MPILRHRSKLSLFAHIPKCGGTSVETYCAQAGISIAFADLAFKSNPAPQKWTVSSPQHVEGYSLNRLFPKSFFDDYFAVVRNPFDRLRSAFNFQKRVERTVQPDARLSDFVKADLVKNYRYIGFCDNHFFPQVGFLAPGNSYAIFKLEDGLEAVKQHIDQTMFGAPLALQMGHANKAKGQSAPPEMDALDAEALALVQEIYKEDFARLGYPNTPATSDETA